MTKREAFNAAYRKGYAVGRSSGVMPPWFKKPSTEPEIAGYIWGESNGAYDARTGEKAFGDDPGDAFDLWQDELNGAAEGPL